MSELRPCPWCKSIPVYNEKKASTVNSGISVNEGEGCEVCVMFCGAAEWNTRPIEDALNAQIKDQEATIDALLAQNKTQIEELEKLEAWQKEALPFLEAECGNLSDCLATSLSWEESIWVNKNDFMTKELYEDIESVKTENHRLLVKLIKQAEDN